MGTMSFYILPLGTHMKMEDRKFFWRRAGDEFENHMVKWAVVM
jgi:hypothetical protein